MKSMLKYLVPVIVVLIITYSCKRDELDLDKIAKSVEFEYEIVTPAVYGDLLMQDFMGKNSDSIITIKGDTTFYDTAKLDLPDMQDFVVEYLNLPYTSRNYLPVGTDLMLICYDSITRQNLDTIKFSQEGIFLNAAPLDNDGNVIEDQVATKEDVISVDNSTAENLLKVATHIIINARLLSDTTRIIPINEKNRIYLKVGVEGKGTYRTSL